MAVAGRPPLLRAIVIVAIGIETGLVVLTIAYGILADGDALARRINHEIAIVASGLFALTTAPAAALLLWGRWLWPAALLTALPVVAVAYQFAV